MNHIALFDRIAPFYAWFYAHQRKAYAKASSRIIDRYPVGSTLLDVGCGTGALSALLSRHFVVHAVDGAAQMIKHAKRLHPSTSITFSVANLLEGLPFKDHSMDVVITSFVMHGLAPLERLKALDELHRIAKHHVIIVDYHQGRHVVIDFVERLENGHYFSFIETFTDDLKKRFTQVEIIPLNSTSALYFIK